MPVSACATSNDPLCREIVSLYAESFKNSGLRREMGVIAVERTDDGDCVIKHQPVDGEGMSVGNRRFAEAPIFHAIKMGPVPQTRFGNSLIRFLRRALKAVQSEGLPSQSPGLFIEVARDLPIRPFIASIPGNRDLSARIDMSVADCLERLNQEMRHDDRTFFDRLLPLGSRVTRHASNDTREFVVKYALKPYDFTIALPHGADAEGIAAAIRRRFGQEVTRGSVWGLSDEQVVVANNIIILKSIFSNCSASSPYHTLKFFADMKGPNAGHPKSPDHRSDHRRTPTIPDTKTAGGRPQPGRPNQAQLFSRI